MSIGAATAKTVKPDDEKLTVNYAINTYVNAISHGQSKGLMDIIDNDLKFSMVAGNQTINYNKDQYLESLKTAENIEQQCTTTTTITGNTPNTTVVTVDMKYQDFTRTSYVTLTKSAKGWKITEIYSLFTKV